MPLTEAEIQALGIAIVLLCIPVLVRVEVKNKASWVLYYPVIPITAYLLYEWAIKLSMPNYGRRVDLILMWPILVLLLAKSWFRWMRLGKESKLPITAASELAITSFLAGMVGFSNPFICPLMAVVYGHRAIYQSEHQEFKMKKLAGLGLMAGYIGLFVSAMGVLGYFSQGS
ncbi:MAG: DUF4190 domain-containing protein [Gammaproteobacteria bacterium]